MFHGHVPAQYVAHAFISVRRLSKRSERAYACTVASPRICASAASTTSCGVDVVSPAQSRKLDRKPCMVIGNLSRQIGGGLFGGLAREATGSVFAFGTTYALGQVAKRYYASGRNLDAAQLKEVFTSLVNEGNALQTRYSNDIVQKSRQINVAGLLPLVKQS